MKKLIILASFGLISVLTGCESTSEPPASVGGGSGSGAVSKDVPSTSGKDVTVKPEVGSDKSDSTKLSDDELAAINKLPEAERALAIAQMTCPVSGDNLGSMEAPIKVTFEGKSAFLCCKSCKKDFEADPDKFLAKVSSKK
jgi:YHS domain-containing protein